MSYVDGFVAAVPEKNKHLYIEHTQRVAKVFREYGAREYVECWGDDVPDGERTSMKMAVKLEECEVVVFSWQPVKRLRRYDDLVLENAQPPLVAWTALGLGASVSSVYRTGSREFWDLR